MNIFFRQDKLDNQDIIFLPFLKKDKKLYSSPRKINALKRSQTAMMIYKNYLDGNQTIIFRRRRIEFSSFLLGRENAQRQIQLIL
jgi:hypothetical protein